MTTAFESLPWHDAELLSIHVDRSRAAELDAVDAVTLSVRWPDKTRALIRFVNCYALSATMNFAVLALESILQASESADCEQVTDCRREWSERGFELLDLRLFTVETNSTASVISVLARGWELLPGDDGE